MKFIQLRNFIAVIEAGTFRQAAKNLRLSQSSISKSLQQLEDEIGAEILHRGARGVIPTAAGEALLSRAKNIEAEMRHARNDVQMIQGAQVGEIRVSVSPTVAVGLLPRAIIEFQSARPRVNFMISEAVYPDMLPAIRSGEIDIAICLVPARPRDETLNFVSLVKDRLVPVVRANHPIVSARNVTLEDLLDLDWVVYRRSHTGLDVFEQTFTSNRLPLPKSTIECTSFACARALVENGDYVTLMPSQLFFDNRKASTVALLALDSPMPTWQVAVITRAKHELSAVCLAFLEEIERVAAGVVSRKEGPRRPRPVRKGRAGDR
ncbi:MAG: LysR family transcriptional regulator [Hyphomicrobiaceae bacterium]